jgi:hypothetical protein
VSSQNEFDDERPTVVAKVDLNSTLFIPDFKLPLSPFETVRLRLTMWWVKWAFAAETVIVSLSMTVTATFKWAWSFFGEK